jgi:hypothetical protein
MCGVLCLFWSLEVDKMCVDDISEEQIAPFLCIFLLEAKHRFPRIQDGGCSYIVGHQTMSRAFLKYRSIVLVRQVSRATTGVALDLPFSLAYPGFETM